MKHTTTTAAHCASGVISGTFFLVSRSVAMILVLPPILLPLLPLAFLFSLFLRFCAPPHRRPLVWTTPAPPAQFPRTPPRPPQSSPPQHAPPCCAACGRCPHPGRGRGARPSPPRASSPPWPPASSDSSPSPLNHPRLLSRYPSPTRRPFLGPAQGLFSAQVGASWSPSELTKNRAPGLWPSRVVSKCADPPELGQALWSQGQAWARPPRCSTRHLPRR
mmetsp:Transcript_2357/g.3959  ORF Transcript_2357/g.3959 Transcript_2357/m.3959 type:complete len:219 (+) Transcript_2357:550-1206(+)